MVAPTGVRNVAETSVEFIENGIVMQTMGRDGLGWTPFLLSMFVFVYLCNLHRDHPDLPDAGHGPHGHPAVPRRCIVWVIYNAVGFKHQGFAATSTACAVPARRARWRCYILVGADRVHLDLPRAARSRSPSDSSPTCSPATSCWSPSPC